MSFREIAISIRAINRASHEFARVSVDAANMGSNVKAASEVAASGCRQVGVEASTMGAEVASASATASSGLKQVAVDAEALTVKVKSLSGVVAGLGAAGSSIIHLAHTFGLLNTEQMRVLASLTYLVTVMGVFLRTSAGIAVAKKVYAAACWLATAAQNALNISYATFLALTGVGIAAIIGAAAAVAVFASQMRDATESVKEYNAAVGEMAARTVRVRTVVRAGEEELYRRGVEP